ncbi:hypothetical protein H9W90_14590 [Polaribacter pectinis]|uniref:Por secretion system C-terminal sorting domain-containing protein n=2 Tax=Polaribacter pectinis TaxID=2738844 RepID=A0A7G9LEU2_9FLAO|nr:hypothetical protein H9W90_14590 [Polaribacter pectinis]
MKTKMKRSLLVVLMLGTLIGYANENNTSTTVLDAKKVKVEFKSVKKGQTITINDENGSQVYNQKIENSGTYSRFFNLTALKNGIYTAELNKDYEILIKTFKVENGNVTFLSEENNKVFKPVIRNEENLVLISKIDFNNKPLNVVIYYKDEVILSETVNGNDILSRVYKLSETEKGNYKVVINTNNRMYIKDFSI